MRIKTLTLKNFKGIKHLELNLDGKDISIYGENATGKTSVMDGFLWLMFDKNSLNQKDFNIKTLDASGEPIHNLEHEVEVEFMDGTTLRKVYFEKWTKKRGQATEEFSGHTVDYYINGVPSKAKEFKDCIDSIVKEDIFKLLSNPLYFNAQMHWKDRRNILFEVCGDVSDSEVIGNRPDLAELAEIVGKRSIDDHKKVIAAKLKEINQELDKLPVRINENFNIISSFEDLDKNYFVQALEALEGIKREKETELSLLNNGGDAAVHAKAILEAENELTSFRNKFEQKKADARIQQHKAYEEANRVYTAKRIEMLNIDGEIDKVKREVTHLEEKISALRAEFIAEDAKVASANSECPTCRQPLPTEQIQEAINIFNQAKSQRLLKINQEGQASKAQLEATIKQLEAKKAKYDHLIKEVDELGKAADARKVTFDDRSVEDEEQYQILQQKASALKVSEPATDNTAKDAIKAIIMNVEADMAEIRSKLAQVDTREKTLARIEELKQQQAVLGDEHREQSRQMYLIEEFVRAKTELVTENINRKFKLARFKLFEEQINGGLTEACEVMYNGVPYGDLNNAMKINIGCDLINTLSKHYGVEVPVWIDNAESVVYMYELDAQMVRLVVSGKHKELTINN